ncbi:MAG: ATP-binding protein [Clostridiales bacterium]|jgi:AAA15 family ATPase/GTPase|nr:ATP-binding protein [Clostridiales bacterium]
MLLKYIVQNYKSIGHKIEFNMFPTQNNIDKRYLANIRTKAGTWEVLRRGALFGANASGKSSFIESIDFARSFIVNGIKSGRRIDLNRFRAEFDDLDGSSLFQFQIYINANVYEYGFSLYPQRVFEEWLMVLTSKGFEPIFQRRTNDDFVTDIEITPLLGKSNYKDRRIADVLKEGMKENQRNQLFLYKLADNGVKKAEAVMRWFEKLQVIFPHSKFHMLEKKLKNSRLADFLGEKLKSYDTGVDKIFSTFKKVNINEMLNEMDVPKKIIEDIEETESGLVEINGKIFIFDGEKGETVFYELQLEHTLNSNKFNFNKEDESDGTKRLLDLLPILFNLENKDSVYFVDEIDRSLHTKITKNFVKSFAEHAADSMNQMIFTTHDVNLINLEEMRQDEIWFVDKSKEGETSIRPFSDFELSDGYDAIRAYIAGRFGAVPTIRNL